MATLTYFRRSTTALALGATLAALPLGFGTAGWRGFDNQVAYARDGDESASDRGPGGGGDRDDDGDRGRGGDDAADDRGRGRDADDGAEDARRGRGADDGVGDARGREAEAGRGRGIEPGDDRGGDRNQPMFADTDFATQGERFRTFVAIAAELGLDPNVGALQAGFGTPRERAARPGQAAPAGPWQIVNLDVNHDGNVNQMDLAAARLGLRP